MIARRTTRRPEVRVLAVLVTIGCREAAPATTDSRTILESDSDECDCVAGNQCASPGAQATRLCSGSPDAVMLERFVDCGMIALVLAEHHWTSTHWYDASGVLLGYRAGDGYVGVAESCGEVPSETCGERVVCSLCQRDELHWQPPPPCDPTDGGVDGLDDIRP